MPCLTQDEVRNSESFLADDCALMQDHRCIRRLHPANVFEILHSACFYLEILSSVVVWCEPGSTFTSLLPWVLQMSGALCAIGDSLHLQMKSAGMMVGQATKDWLERTGGGNGTGQRSLLSSRL